MQVCIIRKRTPHDGMSVFACQAYQSLVQQTNLDHDLLCFCLRKEERIWITARNPSSPQKTKGVFTETKREVRSLEYSFSCQSPMQSEHTRRVWMIQSSFSCFPSKSAEISGKQVLLQTRIPTEQGEAWKWKTWFSCCSSSIQKESRADTKQHFLGYSLWKIREKKMFLVCLEEKIRQENA